VTTVNVVLGDVVKAGDVLAVADDTSAQLQLEIAKADLAAASRSSRPTRPVPTRRPGRPRRIP